MSENLENKCEHCGKTFIRERTLLSHTCEAKRRFLDKDRLPNRIGLASWSAFMRRCQPSSKKPKDYLAFSKSPYYSAFVKFGNYCADSGVLRPDLFSEWLQKNNVGIDYWCSDKQYTTFLIDYLKIEDPFEAIERSVKRLIEHGELENIQLRDTLQYISQNKLCGDIISGRISPWLLYNCSYDIWGRLENNLQFIYPYVDPDVWRPKLLRDAEITADIKNILKQAGL